MSASPLKRRLLIGGAVVLLVLLGAAAAFAAYTWSQVDRVTIDRPTAAEPDESPGGQAEAEPEPEEQAQDEIEIVDPGRQVFLLVGSDTRGSVDEVERFGDFEGNRADVLMVVFKEPTSTGLLSIPRDLLVANPCGGPEQRINSMLEGCSAYNGPSLLTWAVEDLIGQPVDHFAMIDFLGFESAVDAVGGYEICVQNPVRDELAKLDLPGGCTMADGEQTLAWLRSRRTQELTDEGWRTMSGVSDLARNERQREFLIDMMHRAGNISNPSDMLAVARNVAPYMTVDSELSVMDAVNLGFTMQGLRSGEIVELQIPVYDATSDSGASVLLPSQPVDQIVADYLSAGAADGGVVLGVGG